MFKMTQQVTLDIWQRLRKRQRKKVEIQKSMHSLIQYQADLRRSVEIATMRAERDKIKGHMSKMGAWVPQVMRDRYAAIQSALGEPVENRQP